MRFTLPQKQKPYHGEKRSKYGFAILPIRIGNRIIWLEKYLKIQVYIDIQDGMDSMHYWRTTSIELV